MSDEPFTLRATRDQLLYFLATVFPSSIEGEFLVIDIGSQSITYDVQNSPLFEGVERNQGRVPDQLPAAVRWLKLKASAAATASAWAAKDILLQQYRDAEKLQEAPSVSDVSDMIGIKVPEYKLVL